MGLTFKSFIIWTRTEQAEKETGMTPHNLRLVLEYVIFLFASLGVAATVTNITQCGVPFLSHSHKTRVDGNVKPWLKGDNNRRYISYCEASLIPAPSDKYGHAVWWCSECWGGEKVPLQVWGVGSHKGSLFPSQVWFHSTANLYKIYMYDYARCSLT